MQHNKFMSIAIVLKSFIVPSSQAFAILHPFIKQHPFIPRIQFKTATKAAATTTTTTTTPTALLLAAMSVGDVNSTSSNSSLLLSTLDVDGDVFCEIVDDFGCQALEYTSSFSASASSKRIDGTAASGGAYDDDENNMDRWVRLQAKPDIPSMTRSEILQRIDQVQQQQQTYGRSDLYAREWIQFNLPNGGNGNDQCRTFSILQFNVLAQGLSFGPNTQSPFEPTQKLQEYKAKNTYGGFTSVAHPDVCLDFNLRQWRLLQAILDADCDIVALEEMDRFYGFFLPMLQKFGYEGYFVPKVHSPGVKLGWYSDGCAIFYRSSVFGLNRMDSHSYHVGNQVCLVARLCHRPTGKMLQIAATHLKAQQKEECEVMRKQQVDELLTIVSQGSNYPTIVVGDFNTVPSSPSVQKVQRTFASAYDLMDPNLVTTWKTRGSETIKRAIDYVFYSSATLSCAALWSIPHQEMVEHKLPSLRYPSDHILIAAKFQFSSTK
jgi:endonuclease/exonuclease/phosphatase family metal-dependent hydrolase